MELQDLIPSVLGLALAFVTAIIIVIGTWFGKKLLSKLDAQSNTLNKVEVLVNSNMTEAQTKITALEVQLTDIRDKEIVTLTNRILSLEDQQKALDAATAKAAKEAELAELRLQVVHLNEIVNALRIPAAPVPAPINSTSPPGTVIGTISGEVLAPTTPHEDKGETR